MKVSKKTDYCSSCGTYSEQNMGLETFNPSIFDLENYLEYKDFYVYKCPKCGHISYDLSKREDSLLFEKYKEDEDYKNIFNYEYLNGVDLEIFECHTRSVPANLYDAYAYIKEEEKVDENYFRSMHKSFELKEMILEKYSFTVEEDGDEEDRETLEELIALMQENLIENRRIFVDKFLDYKDKNEFLFLMFIENLVKLGEKEQANKNLDWLKKNSNLDKSLIAYITDLVERS